MSKTIGIADLAVAVAAAVASTKQRPEPVVVGLAPPKLAWPQAEAKFGGARQTFSPRMRGAGSAPKAISSFEGWRGNA